MPWQETNTMHQRLLFIANYDKQLYSVTERCERHGVSRKTGYKGIKHYQEDGSSGLLNQLRAPKSCPQRTPESLCEAILELEHLHPK